MSLQPEGWELSVQNGRIPGSRKPTTIEISNISLTLCASLWKRREEGTCSTSVALGPGEVQSPSCSGSRGLLYCAPETLKNASEHVQSLSPINENPCTMHRVVLGFPKSLQADVIVPCSDFGELRSPPRRLKREQSPRAQVTLAPCSVYRCHVGTGASWAQGADVGFRQ